jgi:hypothetical protein
MPRTALVFLLLTSCGYPLIDIQRTRNDIGDISVQKQTYLSLLEKHPDNKDGWFLPQHECDALLYSGLLYAAGLNVDINAAHGGGGRWYRTPDHKCYGEKRSGSDISRDMFAGLMWGIYGRGGREQLRQVYRYGHSRAWLMGRGSFDRTFLTPNFQNTITLMLGLPTLAGESWVDPVKDHQRHIVLLNLLLRGEVQKGLTLEQFWLLGHLKRVMRGNALATFAYHRFTDGDQDETIKILENRQLFPLTRLPTSQDRCYEWLWVRKIEAKRTNPCKPVKLHTGGDFIFIAWLLDNSTRD